MVPQRKSLPFHFVDVFAVEPLTGNSLAVVEEGTDLTLDLFQRIAREFNQSETTFLLPPTRPDADCGYARSRQRALRCLAPAATIRWARGGGLRMPESFRSLGA